MSSSLNDQLAEILRSDRLRHVTSCRVTLRQRESKMSIFVTEGFRAIHGEVLFVEMEPAEGEYEPLLGYIPLEQCGAAVDLIGHRLLPERYVDAKAAH